VNIIVLLILMYKIVYILLLLNMKTQLSNIVEENEK